jgi:hypothetical protein
MLATRQQPPGTCYAVIPYRNYYDSSISVNTIISSPQHFRNISHNTSPRLPLFFVSPPSPPSCQASTTPLSTRPCTSSSLAYYSPP